METSQKVIANIVEQRFVELLIFSLGNESSGPVFPTGPRHIRNLPYIQSLGYVSKSLGLTGQASSAFPLAYWKHCPGLGCFGWKAGRGIVGRNRIGWGLEFGAVEQQFV